MVKRGCVIVVNNVRVVYVWYSCDCVIAKRHNDVKSSVQAFFYNIGPQKGKWRCAISEDCDNALMTGGKLSELLI